MSHIPVMLEDVLKCLRPADGECYIDGTFGAGGYTKAVLAAADCHVLALDRDPNVYPYVEEVREQFGERFRFEQIEFSRMDVVAAPGSMDGVVLDIGVSSMQLDEAGRGFSFMRTGPLDMRMSGQGVSARDVIAHMTKEELITIFKVYGEERRARRCADFIVKARELSPVTTTEQLADIINRALGRGAKHHPATRVFQALRIYVNDELGELTRGLSAAERVLKPGGRLVVVSFHSLEDRIVKSFLRTRSGEVAGGSRYLPEVQKSAKAASFHLIKRGQIKPSQEELAQNPRARSAHLRYAVRTEAPFWPVETTGLRGVRSLEEMERLVA